MDNFKKPASRKPSAVKQPGNGSNSANTPRSRKTSSSQRPSKQPKKSTSNTAKNLGFSGDSEDLDVQKVLLDEEDPFYRENRDDQDDDDWVYAPGEKRLQVEYIQGVDGEDSTPTAISNNNTHGRMTPGEEEEESINDKSHTATTSTNNNNEPLPLVKPDRNESQMVSMYKRYNITQKPMWRFTHEQRQTKGHPYEDYPLEWQGECIHCKISYNDPKTGKKHIPILPPTRFDEKDECWILEYVPQHHPICCKGRIIESGEGNKGERLDLLARFVRQYFYRDLVNITYIPLSYMKEFNPLTGKITREEYDQMCFKIEGLIRTVPFRFVDTSIELINVEQRDKDRRKHFEKLANTPATPKQQQTYEENMKRVLAERKGRAPPNHSTEFAKQLGITITHDRMDTN